MVRKTKDTTPDQAETDEAVAADVTNGDEPESQAPETATNISTADDVDASDEPLAELETEDYTEEPVEHLKVFILGGRVITGGDKYGTFDADSYDHEPNIAATRQFAIDLGLRPVGDVTYVGSDTTLDGSLELTYRYDAVPATKDDPTLNVGVLDQQDGVPTVAEASETVADAQTEANTSN